MKDKDEFFVKAFEVLKAQNVEATEQQKEKMLKGILKAGRAERSSFVKRLRNFIAAYPWRFAFMAATVQTLVCTLIFGANYTSLFLSLF